MRQDIVIIGAGGFATEVVDVIESCNEESNSYNLLGFIVDQQYGTPGTYICDFPILGDLSWLENRARKVSAFCAIGSSHLRFQIIQRAAKIGCDFSNLIHPAAVVTKKIDFGTGIIICAGCILTNQIIIGDHVHINLSCTIGHAAVIHQFVTLAPGVHISGNVNIDDGTYIGTGVNIIENKKIGHWAIIGAGATIIQDVIPNTTVVGNPGRIIKTREQGWQNH